MQEYYFLFGLAFVWIVFATIQDFRKTEVANWLNYSLIAFALAYRGFYALAFDNFDFFYYGLFGFAVFFGLAHLFFHMRVLAGGDAKLLMGMGIVLPFASFPAFVIISLQFIFLLFFLGLVYGIIYSSFLIKRNKKLFLREFRRHFKVFMSIYFFSVVVLLAAAILFGVYNFLVPALIILFVVLGLYAYLKPIEHIMVRRISAKDLMEGDWLLNDVKVGRKTIKKSVHGLSMNEIMMLRRAKKRVMIMQGIPFVLAFLLAYTVTVLVFLTSPSLISSIFYLS